MHSLKYVLTHSCFFVYCKISFDHHCLLLFLNECLPILSSSIFKLGTINKRYPNFEPLFDPPTYPYRIRKSDFCKPKYQPKYRISFNDDPLYQSIISSEVIFYRTSSMFLKWMRNVVFQNFFLIILVFYLYLRIYTLV